MFLPDPSYLAPPDQSGDVGPNHYVQMVNVRTQIWNKSGVSLVGPVDNSTFWAYWDRLIARVMMETQLFFMTI